MSETLKAWCHWKRKEKDVSEDTLLMVKSKYDKLREENAILKETNGAAQRIRFANENRQLRELLGKCEEALKGTSNRLVDEALALIEDWKKESK